MDTKNQTIKFKVAMMEKGLKQRDIAKALNYSENFISLVVLGKRKPPKKFKKWIEENLGGVA